MPDDREAVETATSENMQLLLTRLPEDSLSKQLVEAAAKEDEADWKTTIDLIVEARLENLKKSVLKNDEA